MDDATCDDDDGGGCLRDGVETLVDDCADVIVAAVAAAVMAAADVSAIEYNCCPVAEVSSSLLLLWLLLWTKSAISDKVRISDKFRAVNNW